MTEYEIYSLNVKPATRVEKSKKQKKKKKKGETKGNTLKW